MPPIRSAWYSGSRMAAELSHASDHIADSFDRAESFVGNFDSEGLFDLEGDVDLVEGIDIELVEGAVQSD